MKNTEKLFILTLSISSNVRRGKHKIKDRYGEKGNKHSIAILNTVMKVKVSTFFRLLFILYIQYG